MTEGINTHAIPILNKGFGEYDESDIKARRPTCKQRMRFMAFVAVVSTLAITILGSLGVATGGIVCAFITSSKLAPLWIGAVTGGGLGVCSILGLFFAFHLRKDKTPPSTHTLGLNASDHKAPSLGTFHSNHSALLTEDAHDTWEWRMRLIRAAEQSIEICGNYCGGKTFRDALHEIGELMLKKPTLKFHLLACEEMLSIEDRWAIKKLQELHPERARILVAGTRINNDAESIECHPKGTMIDGYAIMGGTSFQDMLQSKGDGSPALYPRAHWSERTMGQHSRDGDLVVRGDIVKTMRLEFFKLWAVWEYKMSKEKQPKLINRYFAHDPNKPMAVVEEFEKSPKRVDNVKVRLTVSGPEQGRNQITEEFARVISESEGEIRIRSLVYSPDEPIRKALKKKVKAGCPVEIVTNGLHKYSAPISYNFAPTHIQSYSELAQAKSWKKIKPVLFNTSDCYPNVKIHEYGNAQVLNTMMHKKGGIFGNRMMYTSYNYSEKSKRGDYEWCLTTESPELVQQAKPIYDKDVAGSTLLTPQKLRARVRHPLRRLLALLYRLAIVRFSG